MNHLLCMFEEYAGTAEWERLGCDSFLSTTPAGPSQPDLSCAATVDGRESCLTMSDAPGATIKWNGFAETADSVSCSNSFFGDPTPGIVKSCFCEDKTTRCAGENGKCTCDSGNTVYYGVADSNGKLDESRNYANTTVNPAKHLKKTYQLNTSGGGNQWCGW